MTFLGAMRPELKSDPAEGGHVGMIVAGSARRRLWAPLVAWLRRIAAMQK